LDGVYYVRRSELTQDRERQGALRDILNRYAVTVEDVLLISANRPFLEAARELAIKTIAIDPDADPTADRCRLLDRTLKSLG
jgi:methionine salvage enolase-phosphatase E1